MENKIAVTEWEHPDWDMRLVLPDDGSRGKPADFIYDDQDAAKLKAVFHEPMTDDELNKLPDWEG